MHGQNFRWDKNYFKRYINFFFKANYYLEAASIRSRLLTGLWLPGGNDESCLLPWDENVGPWYWNGVGGISMENGHDRFLQTIYTQYWPTLTIKFMKGYPNRFFFSEKKTNLLISSKKKIKLLIAYCLYRSYGRLIKPLLRVSLIMKTKKIKIQNM